MKPRGEAALLVSVVTPLWNAAAFVERRIQLLRAQTDTSWELLLVDDCSTDGTTEKLKGDFGPGIRVFRNAENLGPSAARNVALANALGDWIVYLDADDEFHPDYLEQIRRWSDKAEILWFCYDFMGEGVEGPLPSWDPSKHLAELFLANPCVPLGVAHRRSVIDRVGGFDETLWQAEDWELWKRMARAGLEIVCVPHKSGRYRVRPDSRSRKPRITERQRALYAENRSRGRPLYETRAPARRPDPPRVLFGSPHCLVDPHSGAAAGTLRWLAALKAAGCKVEGVCLTQLDPDEELCVEEVVPDGRPLDRANDGDRNGGRKLRWLGFNRGGVQVYAGRTQFTRRGAVQSHEAAQFLEAFDRHLHERRPDVFLTYGGDEVALAMIRLVKRRDIPIVFALHNFAYTDVQWFHPCDYVLVPSQFASEHYWRALGLHAMVMPNVVDPARVVAPIRAPRYVTFVNPQTTKGVYVFARVAEQVARRRPDVPLLVVESRGRAKESLEATGLDLSVAKNLHFMQATADPRQIYAVSKLVVMPSLWRESFGLVAAEAMANGVPVLASDRGALPETVGDAGLLFSIPERYTPTSTDVPSAAEVEPLVSAIVRLWDDPAFYDDLSRRGRERAERWRPEVVGEKLYDFFAEAFPQPNPPFVPEPWPVEP